MNKLYKMASEGKARISVDYMTASDTVFHIREELVDNRFSYRLTVSSKIAAERWEEDSWHIDADDMSTLIDDLRRLRSEGYIHTNEIKISLYEPSIDPND